MKTKNVLSASRRTDIPAFYMDWFISCLARGHFDVCNPFSNKVKILYASPEDIHSIVFWSKNYGHLLESKDHLREYNLFFHFTLNTFVPKLEPGLSPLDERLEQAKALSRWRGADRLMWRFDPVVLWEEEGKRSNNLSGFHYIAKSLRRIGIERLTLSMMDRYAKIEKRIHGLPAFRFIYPDKEEAAGILGTLAEDALDMGFEVSFCCEKELLELLPSLPVRQGRCIDGELLTRLFGAGADLSPDRGQRRGQGCGCTVSIDVGSYSRQPCLNNCLYCYANPAVTATVVP
ncbi:MAG: DUF1848 family protein [Candidatus Glassbacteria bacterium]